MKKLVLLVILSLLMVTACGNNNQESDSPNTSDNSINNTVNDNNTNSDTGIVDRRAISDSYIEILQSGTYRIYTQSITDEYGNRFSDAVVYAEDGFKFVSISTLSETTQNIATGVEVRIIVPGDGYMYIIIGDVYEKASLSNENANLDGFSRYNGARYIGLGTREFNGKQLDYYEYVNYKDSQIFLFFDGDDLYGMRYVANGVIEDSYGSFIIDQNIPSDAFDVPNYDFRLVG